MDLDDLNKSISDMSDKELEKRLIEIRKRILTKKPAKAKIKASDKQSKTPTPTAKALFSGMTAADREALILELESE